MDHLTVEPETILLLELGDLFGQEASCRLVASGSNNDVTWRLLPRRQNDRISLHLLDFSFDRINFALAYEAKKIWNESLFGHTLSWDPELCFENLSHQPPESTQKERNAMKKDLEWTIGDVFGLQTGCPKAAECGILK